VASLSETVRVWLLGPVLAALEEMRMVNQEQEANVQAALGRIEAALAAHSAQVSGAISELQRLRADLAARTDVDLSQEVGRLDAVTSGLASATQALDAAVPDAPPVEPPPPPAPGA
jgi:ABC-type transporter Mla subunit MlaD